MVVTQHIILDTLRLNTTDIVQGKQGDTNSRALNATITQNGRSLEIPEDAVAIFSVERSDGQSQSFACEIKGDHSVQISLPEWVLEIPGRCSCSISISSGTETVSTLSFILNVQPAEWSRNWIIVHVSSMNELAPGTYYIEVGERGYTFVTTAFVPLNGAVAFNRNFTEAATFGNILLSNHECIETGIVITSGKNGTRLDRNGKTVIGSVIEEMERVWGIVHEALVEQTLLADRVEQEEHDMLAAEVLRASAEEAREMAETARIQAENDRVAASKFDPGNGTNSIVQRTADPARSNTANGDQAAGFGSENVITTDAENGFAEGHGNRVEQPNGHSEGDSNKSRGNAAHSEGDHTEANGDGSHSGGIHTVANNDGETAIGRWGKNNRNPDRLFSVGNGTEGSRSNAFEVGGDRGKEYLSLGETTISAKDLAVLEPDRNVIFQSLGNGTCKVTGVKDHNAKKVDIPDVSYDNEEVAEIAPYALLGCNRLEELRIPFADRFLGVLFRATKAEENRTLVPTSLKKVIVGAGETTVPIGYFQNCRSIEQIEFEDGIEKIDASSLLQTSALKSVILPETLQDIDSCPGADFTGYTEWNGGLYLGTRTNPYFVLIKLTEAARSETHFEVHPDCKILYPYSISGHTNLTELILPEGLRKIGNGALIGANQLESVDIPNSVTHLGQNAFEGCTNLRKIVLGKNLQEIGAFCFENIAEDADIFASRCQAPPTLHPAHGIDSSATIWVNDLEGYKREPVWEDLVFQLQQYRFMDHAIGTEYHLHSAQDLIDLAAAVNGGNTFEGKTFFLDADIDLSGLNWTGIGRTSTRPFMGCFDGRGHTISNMNQTLTNPDGNGGLFNYVRTSSNQEVVIKNFRLTGRIEINMTSGSDTYIGSVVSAVDAIESYGSNRLVLKGIWSSVRIETRVVGGRRADVVGGILGYIRRQGEAINVTVDSCIYDGTINNANMVAYCGGIIGHTGNNTAGRNLTVSIRNTVFAGRICLNDIYSEDVAAFVGYIKGNAGTGTVNVIVQDCISTGKITFYTADGRNWSNRYYGIASGEATGYGRGNVSRLYYKTFVVGNTGTEIGVFCDPTNTTTEQSSEKTDFELCSLTPADINGDWTFLGTTVDGHHMPCPTEIAELFGFPEFLQYE